YTSPVCSPTRAMLLTGVDNHRNGYGTMEGDWAPNQKGLQGYEGHLNFDVVTFPKLLADAGYHTSIAGKWHQSYPVTDRTLWPDQRGFNRSFTLLQGGAGHFGDRQLMFSFYQQTRYVEDAAYVDTLPPSFYSSDFYTNKVIEYIGESVSQRKPFFSFLSYTAPHWPLQVPEEDMDLYHGQYDVGYEMIAEQRLQFAKKLGILPNHAVLPPLSPNVLPWSDLTDSERLRSSRTMEIYAAMVERLDQNVGRLIDYLKSIGEFENTLIVFMSDNGAEGNNVLGILDTETWVNETFDTSYTNMGRVNSYVYTGPSWAQVSSSIFRWYKGFASEGGVRCPVIFHHPSGAHQSEEIYSKFLSVMDLAPTFLELAGVTHPGRRYQDRKIFPMDGVSLLPWLEGRSSQVHADDLSHCWELYGRRGVRRGTWKAEWVEEPYGQGEWELFNLASDPSQQVNLASQERSQLEALVADWDLYAERCSLTLPNQKVAYGKETIWRKD
ncbi:MAG: arylsulfatase, partial [Saprospiraceae bacterium]|nr:arylsulfatase [Saprospiraceae bacterium]